VELVSTFKAIVSGVQSEVTAAVPVMQGYPAWGRPRLVPPVVGVVLAASIPMERARIGAVRPVQTGWTLHVFDVGELELVSLCQKIINWVLQNPQIEVDGVKTTISFVDGRRHEPLTAAIEEQYGFEISVTVAIPL